VRHIPWSKEGSQFTCYVSWENHGDAQQGPSMLRGLNPNRPWRIRKVFFPNGLEGTDVVDDMGNSATLSGFILDPMKPATYGTMDSDLARAQRAVWEHNQAIGDNGLFGEDLHV